MDNTLRIGFELECITRRKRKRNFIAALARLRKRAKNRITTLNDASICHFSMETDVEVVTRHAPFRKAMRVLSECLRLISKYARTNKSCGLHVNISFAGASILTLSQKHDFAGVLEEWGRTTNTYCRCPEILKDRSTDENILRADLGGKQCSLVMSIRDDYFEFRAIGGRNYHRKERQIRANVIQFCRWLGYTDPLD